MHKLQPEARSRHDADQGAEGIGLVRSQLLDSNTLAIEQAFVRTPANQPGSGSKPPPRPGSTGWTPSKVCIARARAHRRRSEVVFKTPGTAATPVAANLYLPYFPCSKLHHLHSKVGCSNERLFDARTFERFHSQNDSHRRSFL